jgi:hypothetical protein
LVAEVVAALAVLVVVSSVLLSRAAQVDQVVVVRLLLLVPVASPARAGWPLLVKAQPAVLVLALVYWEMAVVAVVLAVPGNQ